MLAAAAVFRRVSVIGFKIFLRFSFRSFFFQRGLTFMPFETKQQPCQEFRFFSFLSLSFPFLPENLMRFPLSRAFSFSMDWTLPELPLHLPFGASLPCSGLFLFWSALPLPLRAPPFPVPQRRSCSFIYDEVTILYLA